MKEKEMQCQEEAALTADVEGEWELDKKRSWRGKLAVLKGP